MAKPAPIFCTMFLKPAVIGRKFLKFEVNPSEFVFRGPVLDAKVGHRDSAAHDAESMPLSNIRLRIARMPPPSDLRQVVIQIVLSSESRITVRFCLRHD